jgi:eukaryotic-like serine/threonine-protein kinase
VGNSRVTMSEPTSELPPGLPPDPDLAEGQQVGEYRVDGKLGQGAFGTVFRAVHPLIGKVVAIKVLSRRFSVDPEMVSRFMAEARAVNQIRHRHIIDIFSFGQLEDGRHYYVMEYLDGETLDATIDREGPLPLPRALPILRAVARALDAAHAKGIAHRDLKAENVFLAKDPDGGAFGVWPKLLDFGIAKLLAPDDGLKHRTRTGTPVGTPYYMSPEQCRGRDVDHRTDLYALGVLAYLVLTGEFPFDADDYMSILIKQMADHPAPPSTIVADLPAGVDDAIGWLMKKDPADRPSHARAAIQALEQACEQAGIPIGSTSAVYDQQSGGHAPLSGRVAVPTARTIEPQKRTSRSKRGIYIAIGATVGALAAMAYILFARTAEDEPAKPSPPTVAKQEPPAQPAPTPPVPTKATPTETPVSKSIVVTVTGAPEGTEVLAGGNVIAALPAPVPVPRGSELVVLTFKLDGYVTASKAVTPDHDQTLAVTLKKKASATTRPKPSKDAIEDYDFSKKEP